MSLLIREYLLNASRVVSILSIVVLFFGCSSAPTPHIIDNSSQKKSRQQIHVVVLGDTLYSIAWRYGLDYHALAAFNHIKPPYTIHSGQRLRLDIRVGKVNIPERKTVSTSKLTNNKKAVSEDALADRNQEASKGTIQRSVVERSEIKTKPVSPSVNNAPLQGTVKWQWPANGRLLARFQGAAGFDKGIDIEGKLGESVIAAAAGQIVYAGSGLRGYGNLLIIKHNENFLSAYAHNNKLLVSEGNFVKAGQRIADMGLSGTDRVKLHFEIRNEGEPVDPQKYLPRR